MYQVILSTPGPDPINSLICPIVVVKMWDPPEALRVKPKRTKL